VVRLRVPSEAEVVMRGFPCKFRDQAVGRGSMELLHPMSPGQRRRRARGDTVVRRPIRGSRKSNVLRRTIGGEPGRNARDGGISVAFYVGRIPMSLYGKENGMTPEPIRTTED